jgi:hypothetical protein
MLGTLFFNKSTYVPAYAIVPSSLPCPSDSFAQFWERILSCPRNSTFAFQEVNNKILRLKTVRWGHTEAIRLNRARKISTARRRQRTASNLKDAQQFHFCTENTQATEKSRGSNQCRGLATVSASQIQPSGSRLPHAEWCDRSLHGKAAPSSQPQSWKRMQELRRNIRAHA